MSQTRKRRPELGQSEVPKGQVSWSFGGEASGTGRFQSETS